MLERNRHAVRMRNEQHAHRHEQGRPVEIEGITRRQHEADCLLGAAEPFKFDQEARQRTLGRRGAEHDKDLVLDITQEPPQAKSCQLRDDPHYYDDEEHHDRIETQNELSECDQHSRPVAAHRVSDGAEGAERRQLHHQVDEREQDFGNKIESLVDPEASTFRNGEYSDTDHDGQYYHLKQLSLDESANEVVRHDMHDKRDETLWLHLCDRRRCRSDGYGRHALSYLQQVAWQQADHQGNGRYDFEIDDRTPSDPARALDVAGRRDAMHDGEKHQRRDTGLDKRQENIAQHFKLSAELRENQTDGNAEDQSCQNLHAQLAVPRQPFGRRNARRFV